MIPFDMIDPYDDAEEDEDGNRVIRDDYEGDDAIRTIVIAETPECPGCDMDDAVQCAECGEGYVACMCDPDYAVNTFWCQFCDIMFDWEPDLYGWEEADRFNRIDEIVEDDIVEAVTADDDIPLECRCPRQKAFVCGVCNVQRDTENGPWRVYLDEGELVPLDADDKDDDTEVKCRCLPEAKYYCATCMVSRPTPTSEWVSLATDKVNIITTAKATAAATKKTTPAKANAPATKKVVSAGTGYGYASGASSSYGWYGKCRHYGETLTFPNGVSVNASSMNNNRKADEPAPDFGLYLDWGWKPEWRAEVISWPDFGLPHNDEAAVDAIIEMYERAEKGWVVEVGCIGGHGRTGTVLACMGVLAGLEPKESIKYVRKNYCHETVEGAKQEWWVEWFDAYVNLKPIPEKPVTTTKTWTATKKATTTTTTTTASKFKGEGGDHGMEHHYTMFLEGKTSCGPKYCKWEADDWRRFNKGDIPEKLRAKYDKKAPVRPSIVIDGFFVPKPARGEQTHKPHAKKGCQCDYCRYTAKHGAFLEPVEKRTEIKIRCKGGELVITPIDNTKFVDMPPVGEGLYDGLRVGKWVWTDSESDWVWTVASTDTEDATVEETSETAELPEGLPFPKPNIKSTEQEPEQFITPQVLRAVTLGLTHFLDGQVPTTVEIRTAIRDFDDDEWHDLMVRAAIQSGETAEPTGDKVAELAADKNYCLGCQSWVEDHRTSTCPNDAVLQAHMADLAEQRVAAMEAAAGVESDGMNAVERKRFRLQKRHKRTKGGSKKEERVFF